MTRLGRRVRREVPQPRRSLIVTLAPCGEDGTVEVREKGRRRGFAITVSALYVILAQREAESRRQARRKRRGSALLKGARA